MTYILPTQKDAASNLRRFRGPGGRAADDASINRQIYEANVQAYRGIAVSAQSFLLAVGAVLLGTDIAILFWFVAVVAVATTWWIFFPAIFARTAIVDFHKYRLDRDFDSDGYPVADRKVHRRARLSELDYARTMNFALRRRVYRELTHRLGFTFRTMRETRRKIDHLLGSDSVRAPPRTAARRPALMTQHSGARQAQNAHRRPP